jgi:hypothetical protein
MTITPTTSLAERVYAEVLRGESPHAEAAQRCLALELDDDGTTPTARETEWPDFGFVFGVAYRWTGSDGAEQRAKEALEAAYVAFCRWAGSVSPRPTLAPLAENVLVAGEQATAQLDGLIAIPELLALKEALFELTQTYGVPKAA